MPNDAPASSVRGLHHVTAMAGDPSTNLAFYTDTLGLRLVKRSVNQDAPEIYHLFYADADGSPGTDLTFFPNPGMPRGTRGVGQIVEVAFSIPEGSLAYWADRLAAHDVPCSDRETRFGEIALPFQDPDGMHLALIETARPMDVALWDESPVPATHQLRGMHSVRLWERELEPTERLLTDAMGLQKAGTDGDWHRYGLSDGRPSTIADVRIHPDGPRGRGGAGVIHHAAWRTPTDADQEAMRAAFRELGLRPTRQIDRFWFRSVYAHEPGGALFELATDDPGFTADEAHDRLGETLILPPWLEGKRNTIESALPPLSSSAA